MKKINFSSVLDKILLVLKRFPISILLILGFASMLFGDVNFDMSEHFNWLMFFLVGTFATVSATLLLENFKICLWRYAITVCIAALWLIYCLFLPEKSIELCFADGLQIFIIGAAAFLSIFFISFFGKNRELSFWNFTQKTVAQFIISSFFSSILCGGLCVAALAIDQLFNVKISDKVYQNIAIVCFSIFAPIYFWANMADKVLKFNEEVNFSKLLKIFGLYILTPILGIYILILYGYLSKIIVEWQLPNGWVSWLVSVLSVGGLLIISILYPLIRSKENKVAVFLSKYFGLIILPLLVLMTIGIFRRINDYGITILRLYILALNIWFYAIYIYLFIIKSLKIKWIYISFTAILLLVSVGPLNFSNITKNIMTKNINKILNNSKLDIKTASIFFNSLDTVQRKKSLESIKYLLDKYGKNSLQPFFNDSLSSKYSLLSKIGYYYDDIVEIDAVEPSRFYEFSVKNPQKFSKNQYNSFIFIDFQRNKSDKATDYQNLNYYLKDTTLIIKIVDKKKEFEIPFQKISEKLVDKYSNYNYEINEINYKSNSYSLHISEISLRKNSEETNFELTNLEGVLFFNE
jgi:hypothetical protein